MNNSTDSYRKQLKKLPPKFCDFFKDKTYIVKQWLIYDPDTINIVIPIEDQLVTFPARLLGFDAIEKKLKSQDIQHLNDNDAQFLQEKYAESENLLQNLLSNQEEITVKCEKLDLYGRILVNMYVKDQSSNEMISVNQKLIDSKLVFPYCGKTKLTIDQQIQFLKNADM